MWWHDPCTSHLAAATTDTPLIPGLTHPSKKVKMRFMTWQVVCRRLWFVKITQIWEKKRAQAQVWQGVDKQKNVRIQQAW